MSLGLAAQIEAARLVIAALVPTTDPSHLFVKVAGGLPSAREPRTLDRRFSVQPDYSAGTVGAAFSADELQFLGGLVVQIRYDSKAQRETLITKIAEDTEQIVRALESAAARTTGVQRITYTSGEIDDENADFVLRTLSFEVLYRRNFDAADDSFVVLVAQGLRFSDNEAITGAVDGVNAAFTLARTPDPAASLRLYVNGVRDSGFTLAGAVVTFGVGSIPQVGDELAAWFRYLGDA